MKNYVKDYKVVNEEGKLIKFKKDVTLDCEIQCRDGGKIYRYSKDILCYCLCDTKLNLNSKGIKELVIENRNTDCDTLFMFNEKDLLKVRDWLGRKGLDCYRQ